MQHAPTYRYHLAALFSVIVWGATFVSTKVLIAHGLNPAEIFLLRFVLAYLCILPLARRRLFAESLRDEALLLAAGVCGGSFYFLTENMALEFAPASNVSLIVCTAPVWTALVLSILDPAERMSRRQIAGSALAFAGMVLVSSTAGSSCTSPRAAICWRSAPPGSGSSTRSPSSSSPGVTPPSSSPARSSSTGF